MKVWATLYNFFAVLLIMFMFVVLYKDISANEKQFQELRLKYAVDYATDGAFMASLEGGNLGISYQDLQNIRVIPENTLSVFKSILALSYDMSVSQDNLNALDSYISSAVLAVADGYYIATPYEVDTARTEAQGGEYQLKWGLKKPYTIQYGDKEYVAYNLSSERWILARQVGSTLRLERGEKWETLKNGQNIEYSTSSADLRAKIITAVNQRIADDINYNIKKRNEELVKQGVNDFVYLPSVQTESGVNAITKPSFFITLSGVDFTGIHKIDSQSVGGYTIAKKRRVLGFTEDGEKYYAYEGQLDDLSTVSDFYNTVDEAAEDGFRPHVDYLRRPLK